MHPYTCKSDSTHCRVLQPDRWWYKAVHHYPPTRCPASISASAQRKCPPALHLIKIHRYNLLVSRVQRVVQISSTLAQQIESVRSTHHLKYSCGRKTAVKECIYRPYQQQSPAPFHKTAAQRPCSKMSLFTLSPMHKRTRDETRAKSGTQQALHTLMTLYRDDSHQ